MRRTLCLLAVVLVATSCSSKSEKEKAAEEVAAALEEVQEAVAEAVGGEVGEIVEVSEETARAWPDKFCSLENGMTRDEVQAIMGTPTTTYRDQVANQDNYEAWGWQLTIFYDVDDRAEQLYSNDLASGKVPCESVRFSE